jgi:hypothetical protein
VDVIFGFALGRWPFFGFAPGRETWMRYNRLLLGVVVPR